MNQFSNEGLRSEVVGVQYGKQESMRVFSGFLDRPEGNSPVILSGDKARGRLRGRILPNLA